MGGKMGLFVPAQKALLKLLQEAVPVGYVHILQIFELRQECSRSEGVVTVSFQLREALTLLSYVFCAHRADASQQIAPCQCSTVHLIELKPFSRKCGPASGCCSVLASSA